MSTTTRESQYDGLSAVRRSTAMFLFFSNRKGCLGSLVISIVGSLLLFLILRGCQGGL